MSDPRDPASSEPSSGFVRVDGYLVDGADAETYVTRREEAAARALAALAAAGWRADRDWAGSEDGEAVIACDDHGTLVGAVHLDPWGVESILAAPDDDAVVRLVVAER